MWRRGWDPDSAAFFGFCKLQIPPCRRCRNYQGCRGALHAAARWTGCVIAAWGVDPHPAKRNRLGKVHRPPYSGTMRIWVDVPDAIGDRVAAPGQDLSEAAFHALVIDAYRMGRLTEHELREVLDLPTRDAVGGFLKAHGVLLDYSVEDLAEERALAARLWPDTAAR